MSEIWRAIRKVGLGEYLRQFYKLGGFKGGELVGMDEIGNKYYEVRDERFKQPCNMLYLLITCSPTIYQLGIDTSSMQRVQKKQV